MIQLEINEAFNPVLCVARRTYSPMGLSNSLAESLCSRGYSTSQIINILEKHTSHVGSMLEKLRDDQVEIQDLRIVSEEGVGNSLSFKMNGKEFRYVSPIFTAATLRDHFLNTIEGHGTVYALRWLKSNAVNYYGADIELSNIKEAVVGKNDPLVQAKRKELLDQYLKKFFSDKQMDLVYVDDKKRSTFLGKLVEFDANAVGSSPLSRKFGILDIKKGSLYPICQKAKDVYEKLDNRATSYDVETILSQIALANAIAKVKLGESRVIKKMRMSESVDQSAYLSIMEAAILKEAINPWDKKDADQSMYTFYLNQKNVKYSRVAKGKTAEIQYMSPSRYFQLCGKVHNTSETIERRQAEGSDTEKYANLMKKGTKFPIPVIDFTQDQQEGRHRVAAAESIGVGIIPVLVVSYYELALPKGFMNIANRLYWHNKGGEECSDLFPTDEDEMIKAANHIRKTGDFSIRPFNRKWENR